LKLSSNMNMYRKKAHDVLSSLTRIQKDIEVKQELLKSDKIQGKESIDVVMKIIKDVEEEGKRLSSDIDPLNEEMEKLLKEEQELWRQIKEKYYNLKEEDIVEYVRGRLKEANLI
jgi:uncharacterized protein YoxC